MESLKYAVDKQTSEQASEHYTAKGVNRKDGLQVLGYKNK
jgi:hypothetical protein